MRRWVSESGKGLPPHGGRSPPERQLRHDVYEGALSRLTEICLRGVRLRCIWRGRLRVLLHRCRRQRIRGVERRYVMHGHSGI